MIEIAIWLLYGAILYTTIFTMLVFLESGRLKQDVEWLDEWPSVSFVIPAYNEEDSIAMTIESVLDIDYPEDKMEVIVVDDGSQDDTADIASQYTDDERVKLIGQGNQGKGGALNTGLENATGDFLACVDADSHVKEEAVKNIISGFDDDVGAIASAMKVYEPETWVQKMQWLEYMVGIFMRNIMGILDAINVTPGPLSVYRKDVIEDLGGFDEESLVEDQEICFKLQESQWKVNHSRKGEVYTVAPSNLRELLDQRKRWYRGSIENAIKYKHLLFNPDYGDFGMFGVPANLMMAGLSVFALFLISFLTLQPIYSIIIDISTHGLEAVLFSLESVSISSVLTGLYWGILNMRFINSFLLFSLFSLSFITAYFAAEHTEENLFEQGVLPTFIYMAWYVFFIGFAWLVVFYEMARDAERVW